MAKGQVKQKQNKISSILFENLCAIQCSEAEICAVLDISDKTLNKWCNTEYGCNFSEIYKIKRLVGMQSLRRQQFKLAEKNPTMAIWLGKQYLGQTDKIESETTERIEIINDIPKSDDE